MSIFAHIEEEDELLETDMSEDSDCLEEIWEDDNSEFSLNSDIQMDEDCLRFPQVDATSSTEMALVYWLLLFILRLQARPYLPDAALKSLLKFLHTVLVIIGRYSDFVARMADAFPTSLYLLHKYFGISEDFKRYVVCKKCYSVYDYKFCIERIGTTSHSKLCTHKEHPNSRLRCDAPLLKTVELNNGGKTLYPFKVFCYRSLKMSLQNLLLRAGFVDACEHWRSRKQRKGVYQDIYDGQIWKDFQYIDGKPFLAEQNVFALMLNIDWFKPFKHTPASVGAMYVTIMNLPYDQRFKRENVILLGIIPGPSEPKRDLNDYLHPFIKELQELFTGVFNGCLW